MKTKQKALSVAGVNELVETVEKLTEKINIKDQIITEIEAEADRQSKELSESIKQHKQVIRAKNMEIQTNVKETQKYLQNEEKVLHLRANYEIFSLNPHIEGFKDEHKGFICIVKNKTTNDVTSGYGITLQRAYDRACFDGKRVENDEYEKMITRLKNNEKNS